MDTPTLDVIAQAAGYAGAADIARIRGFEVTTTDGKVHTFADPGRYGGHPAVGFPDYDAPAAKATKGDTPPAA